MYVTLNKTNTSCVVMMSFFFPFFLSLSKRENDKSLGMGKKRYVPLDHSDKETRRGSPQILTGSHRICW